MYDIDNDFVVEVALIRDRKLKTARCLAVYLAKMAKLLNLLQYGDIYVRMACLRKQLIQSFGTRVSESSMELTKFRFRKEHGVLSCVKEWVSPFPYDGNSCTILSHDYVLDVVKECAEAVCIMQRE